METGTAVILAELRKIMNKLDELDRKISEVDYVARQVKRTVRS